MSQDCWSLLEELDDKLAMAGAGDLSPLLFRLFFATRDDAERAHELALVNDATAARKRKAADRHALYDAAIRMAVASQGVAIEPTTKFAKSIETVVYSYLICKLGFTEKAPSWRTIHRRLIAISSENRD